MGIQAEEGARKVVFPDPCCRMQDGPACITKSVEGWVGDEERFGGARRPMARCRSGALAAVTCAGGEFNGHGAVG